MKAIALLAFLLLFVKASTAQFENYFSDRSLRIDYVHAGTATTEWYALDELIAEPFWGGSKTNLIDTLKFGDYFIEVYDQASNKLIYSRGYGSLFGEWQTIAEAKQLTRSFNETVIVPYPLAPIDLVFYSRNHGGNFDSVFSLTVDPANYFIRPIQTEKWPVHETQVNAPAAKAIDIVLLPDGYTADEMAKFISDSYDFAESFFSFEPFKSFRAKFNIRAVLAPSDESGATIPADSVWRKTILSSTFYTFDLERYSMTYDHKKVRDLAANAPYDQIYILLNSKKYGGGGIYNFYSLSTTGNALADKVIVHEFGHGFAGLGDEYFTSDVAYQDFYNLEIEPWEPNLTTLVNFERKWPHLLANDTPVPTPDKPKYHGVTGVFEGGGYTAKGMYRPSQSCLMNTFDANTFCAVCKETIVRMIRFYTD
jgi:hypothetical protein